MTMEQFNVLSLPSLSFEELENECAIIDWRASSEEVIEAINVFVPQAMDALVWSEDEDGGSIGWGDKVFPVPLTFTAHDRYVVISSVAYVFKDHLTFWLLKDRLGDDTHSVLFVTKTQAELLKATDPQWVSTNLVDLELGYDYFGKLRVPYTGRIDNNPKFREEAAALQAEQEEFVRALRELRGMQE